MAMPQTQATVLSNRHNKDCPEDDRHIKSPVQFNPRTENIEGYPFKIPQELIDAADNEQYITISNDVFQKLSAEAQNNALNTALFTLKTQAVDDDTKIQVTEKTIAQLMPYLFYYDDGCEVYNPMFWIYSNDQLVTIDGQLYKLMYSYARLGSGIRGSWIRCTPTPNNINKNGTETIWYKSVYMCEDYHEEYGPRFREVIAPNKPFSPLGEFVKKYNFHLDPRYKNRGDLFCIIQKSYYCCDNLREWTHYLNRLVTTSKEPCAERTTHQLQPSTPKPEISTNPITSEFTKWLTYIKNLPKHHATRVWLCGIGLSHAITNPYRNSTQALTTDQ